MYVVWWNTSSLLHDTGAESAQLCRLLPSPIMRQLSYRKRVMSVGPYYLLNALEYFQRATAVKFSLPTSMTYCCSVKYQDNT